MIKQERKKIEVVKQIPLVDRQKTSVVQDRDQAGEELPVVTFEEAKAQLEGSSKYVLLSALPPSWFVSFIYLNCVVLEQRVVDPFAMPLLLRFSSVTVQIFEVCCTG